MPDPRLPASLRRRAIAGLSLLLLASAWATPAPAGGPHPLDPLSTPGGGAYQRERVVCIFERDTAAPLWRHYEALNQVHEGRPATELVVRSIPSIAHYDYVIDWVFTQSGEIQVNLGATGIDAVKGVATAAMADPDADAAAGHGALVAPRCAAVFHDHYFSIRLDFDIDGPVNRFVRERLTPVTLPEGDPRRSLWQLEAVPMPTEGGLSARDGPEDWPVLTTVWQGVKLRPYGFFTQNPGLGVRRRFRGDGS